MKTAIRGLVALVALGLVGAASWRWQLNGWGSLVWLAAMVLMTIIRAPYASRTKANAIVDKREVAVERALLILVVVGGSLLPLIHLATGVFAFANYRLPDWAVIAGAALMVPGFWLFWRSHADLGLNWSVTTELREHQELITSGVYKRIRHPMYTAIWLLFLPQPLLVQNWLAGLAGPLSFAILYFIRVPYEEDMMRGRFGDAYDDYCRRSGRLWPR